MSRATSSKTRGMVLDGDVDVKPDITQPQQQQQRRQRPSRNPRASLVAHSSVDVKMEIDDVNIKPNLNPSVGEGPSSRVEIVAGPSTQRIKRTKKEQKPAKPRLRAGAGSSVQSGPVVNSAVKNEVDGADRIMNELVGSTGAVGGMITGQDVREAFSFQDKVEVEQGKARGGERSSVKNEAPMASGSGTGAGPLVPAALDQVASSSRVKNEGKGKGKAKVEPVPRRPVMWRKKCPKSTMDRLDRVMSQRMFLLDRSGPSSKSEDFKILGSTGNVYTVTIGSTPLCDCPDAGKGNIPCKHIIFVFMKVLKLSPASELWYQKYLLDDELVSIFATAPPVAQGAYEVPARARDAYLKASGRESEVPLADREPEPESESSTATGKPKSGPENLNRKDPIGEDCPVCFEEVGQEDIDKNLLVWDDGLYGCGKALHIECFKNWATSVISREGAGAEVKCVWCRSTWPTASTSAKGSGNGVGLTSGGYLNIGDLVGVSRKRDISSYYWGPMRGRRLNDPRYEDH